MKANEIREMSIKEIEQRIAEESADLSRLHFQRAVAALENPLVVRTKRRNIARMRSILRQMKAEG
jgi:large subunit ribosomal protein L29